ncbi:hypothetical protein [Novosphingobium resinovorum]|uniref:hypothetical protein n=1 Tax=Novosphingobium resinovorum TaxID=158500 RepID=UPI0012EABBAA|nr:hypothetical protein [Novosphingobium resinovorum]
MALKLVACIFSAAALYPDLVKNPKRERMSRISAILSFFPVGITGGMSAAHD